MYTCIIDVLLMNEMDSYPLLMNLHNIKYYFMCKLFTLKIYYLLYLKTFLKLMTKLIATTHGVVTTDGHCRISQRRLTSLQLI